MDRKMTPQTDTPQNSVCVSLFVCVCERASVHLFCGAFCERNEKVRVTDTQTGSVIDRQAEESMRE